MPTPKEYNPKRMMVEHERERNERYYSTCSYFGCGKELSLIESLAGTNCTEHMNFKKQSHTMLLRDKFNDTYFDTIKLNK